jgi:hypothetical protein
LLILKKYYQLTIFIKIPLRLLLSVLWWVRKSVDSARGKRYSQIVICGYPRGGTSLLYNMISASLDGFYFDEFESRAVERIHRYGNYVTKSPIDIFDLKEIVSLNKYKKDIFILVVVRDVRDVITSRHPYIPEEFFIGHDYSWWPQNQDFSKWKFDGYGVIDIHHAINEAIDEGDLNIIKVNYEGMVSDVDGLQQTLEERLGVTFSRELRSFYKHLSKLAYKYESTNDVNQSALVFEDKPVDTSRTGKWKKDEFKLRVRDQFNECPELFDILIRDGYEVDRLWFEPYK